MGISTGGKSGGVKSDINVTPLVDVVLVLLIIFLVTMPVVMRTVTIEVPRKIDAETETFPGKQIAILVKEGGDVVLSDGSTTEETVPRAQLASKLRPMLERTKNEKVVFVDFEDNVQYEQVVSVMDTVRSLASDKDHSEVKVALKTKDDVKPQ